MFENPGRKIKGVAKFVCWVGIAASVIIGVIMVIGGVNLAGMRGSNGSGEMLLVSGVVVALIGSFASWVGALIVYGIGTMVENSCVRTELAVKQAIERGEA